MIMDDDENEPSTRHRPAVDTYLKLILIDLIVPMWQTENFNPMTTGHYAARPNQKRMIIDHIDGQWCHTSSSFHSAYCP